MRVGLFIVLAVALVGCQRTRVTPAAYLTNLKVVTTPVGIDVSFELLDRDREPTLVLFGTGVIRIEDRPDSLDADTSTASAGRVDSTWLLYNAQFYVSRDHFSRERRASASSVQIIPICHLGVYPYRHFLRKPRRRDGVVEVAFVAVDGSYVMADRRRVTWPKEAFDEEVGKPVQRFGY